jgi:1-acyl-sn-glycerol-3-phosphate acyltransferase
MRKRLKRLGKNAYRPITKYDALINLFLKPVDLPIRGVWTMINKLGIGQRLSNTVRDNLYPLLKELYKKIYNLEIKGIDNIPNGRRAIITPNHSSWLDAQLLGPILPEKTYFLAKKELLRMPIFGVFMEVLNAISIDRDYVDIKGLKRSINILKKENHLVIFPEGTIPGEEELSRDDVDKETGLLPGNLGPVILAIRAKAPIVPVGIRNTDKALPPEAFPRLEELPPSNSPKIEIIFGNTIYYKQYYNKKLTQKELKILTKKLMIKIGKLAGKNQVIKNTA